MPNILFIRHAQSEGNAKGILLGSSRQYDYGITAVGREEARQKGRTLSIEHFKPQHVYCSELKRARQTAEIICHELGLKLEPTVLSAFNERSFGRYEGQPYADILAAIKEYGHDLPTTESVDVLVARVLEGFNTIQQHAHGDVLVVTHSNPLAVIRCHLYYPDRILCYWEHEDDNYLEGLRIEI